MLPAAGLQAWERPDSDNKQHLAPLTPASFGSGKLSLSSSLVFPLLLSVSGGLTGEEVSQGEAHSCGFEIPMCLFGKAQP